MTSEKEHFDMNLLKDPKLQRLIKEEGFFFEIDISPTTSNRKQELGELIESDQELETQKKMHALEAVLEKDYVSPTLQDIQELL